MSELQDNGEVRKWLIWGLLLSWSTVVPVVFGVVENAPNGVTGARDMTASVVVSFTVFGLAMALLSQVVAIVFLVKSFPFGYRALSMLAICWSTVMLFLSGSCIWLLVQQVVVR